MPKQNTGSFVPSQLRDQRYSRSPYIMAIEEGLSRGESYAQIGARVGVSKQYIYQIVLRAKLPKSLHRGGRPRLYAV